MQQRLRERMRSIIGERYGIDNLRINLEQPPQVAMGDYATPVAFELARPLRRSPKQIAAELLESLQSQPLAGFAGFEVAGAGYLNARLDRGTALTAIAKAQDDADFGAGIHSLVEHTSINPNKAAHVGHLRNAILGDTFVRMLRAAGQRVDVQNYIDNTGVQVADVVVGLMHLENLSREQIATLFRELAARNERLDYYCWNIYAKVSAWYDADDNPDEKANRRALRLGTLHAIEAGGNEIAAAADTVSTAVLRRHLETMLRLEIEYDFLPRESEILHLHFWDLAFRQLKERGVLYLEKEGKNKGCWVMRRAGTESTAANNGGPESVPDEDAKVIVRSNGTVTYVGKDIAYHLWKFGLLGRDFGYRRFFEYPDHTCWISAEHGEHEHPHFGGAQAIYNVIDSRQADPQANVIEALRGMGYTDAANRYVHFSYEMVALTPRCAAELGYTLSDEDRGRAYIEVSGRKGFGVKADDLIDRLIAAAKSEVDSRHPELNDAERRKVGTSIAIGALRYFMLKYTRNSVIAFDFRDALSFEGETGPYVQYAVVRVRSIFRKGGMTAAAALAAVDGTVLGKYVEREEDRDIWELWQTASKTSLLLEQSIATAEPAYLAKHAFQLAQQFNNFYHRFHILTEQDAERKKLLLATAAVAERELIRVLGWLGIDAPEVM
ncbi:MAG TPA: arginine--tRNA ligase [Acidobacteriaceae bacterium]|jgi:arginyl-tRNA synthetase|nr:arginine--tRNA ligase [Acidobacteriaceae bacterium]